MENFKTDRIPAGKKRFLIAVCILLSALFAGCSDYYRTNLPLAKEMEIPGDTFSFDRGVYPAPLHIFAEYKLVPGDLLDVLFQISTWTRKKRFLIGIDHTVSVKFVHAPELNETQKVKADGKISLPYVGEVLVEGKTTDEVASELKKSYATILRFPEIYVAVPEYNSRIIELKHDLHTAPRGLSRLVSVRPDGYCTFPLVGDIFVAGKTIPQVSKELEPLYEHYLPGLHVNLFLQKHAGSRIYVMGRVNHTGAYMIAGPINVMQALTLAGGHLTDADLTRVLIMRRHKEKMVATRLDLSKVLRVEKNADFFYARPDDIIYVPRRGLSQTSEIIKEISDIILFRGWGSSLDGPLFERPLFRKRSEN